MNPFRVFSKRNLALIASACMLSAGSTLAADGASDDLDLSALLNLNMEVTVASKKAEKISDAPGMIVAYSEADMNELGHYTIRDLTRQTTGYSPFYSIGEITLESRGQKAAGWENNKHLLMVDGIPVRHARGGAVPVEEEMSLYGAKRVEFLKGPGSALYGTGAFFGVINVVGDTPTEEGVSAKGMITGGSDNLSKRAMGHMVAKNENGTFKIDISHFQKETDGTPTLLTGTRTYRDSDENVLGSEDITFKAYRNWDDKNATYLNMSYKRESGALAGFTGGYLYSRKSSGMGEFWWMNTSPLNNVTWEIMIPYVKFEKEFSDKFSFNSYLLANQSVEHALVDAEYASGKIEEYMVKVADMEALLEGNLNISEKAGNVIFGLNYDIRKSLGNNTSFGSYKFHSISGDSKVIEHPSAWESDPFHTISMYAQYQNRFDILSGLLLTVGMREDIGKTKENQFSQFSPRAGIVQKFTDNINLKFLYGTALRAPGIKSAGVNAEVINELKAMGDSHIKDVPELGAEVIRSWETSMNFSFDKFSANVAGFYNQTFDEITKIKITNDDGGNHDVYDNSKDSITAYGLEIDLKAIPVNTSNNTLKLGVGTAVSKAFKNSDSTQFSGVPAGKINGMISYTNRAWKPITLTPSFNMYTKYRNGGDPEVDANYIEELEGNFYTVDLNMNFQLSKHFGIQTMIKNLTDNRYYQPGIWLYSNNFETTYNGQAAIASDGGVLNIQQPGRSVAVSFTANF